MEEKYRVTFGAEIEFMLAKCDAYDNELRKYGLHRDWGLAFEVETPVARSDDVEAAVAEFVKLEWLVQKNGYRVHYARYNGVNIALCETYSDRRPMSAHLHFAISPYDPVIMARLHNWILNLSILLAPAFVLPVSLDCYDRCEYNDSDDSCSVICNVRRDKWYRTRVGHFALTPAYVSPSVYEIAVESSINYRGYLPSHGNSYYAVEVNKYRKSQVTVEMRVNEQNVLISAFLAWVLERLVRLKPFMLLPTSNAWNLIINKKVIRVVNKNIDYIPADIFETSTSTSSRVILIGDDYGIIGEDFRETVDNLMSVVDRGDAPQWVQRIANAIKDSYYNRNRVVMYAKLMDVAASMTDDSDVKRMAVSSKNDYMSMVDSVTLVLF